MDHPKVALLTDGAFRLWVQGLSHCQKYLTDGKVDRGSLRLLRSFSPKRQAELVAARLWQEAEEGIEFHDYLDWNESREHVLKIRYQARERIKKLRGRNASGNGVTACERDANASGVYCVSSELASSSTERERGTGRGTHPERAGGFCEWYADTHSRLIGVGYIGNPQKDYQTALQLVAKFADDELRDAAIVWFGQRDNFATNGTRTVTKFASRASALVMAAREVAS
jgi:hypothetical protein